MAQRNLSAGVGKTVNLRMSELSRYLGSDLPKRAQRVVPIKSNVKFQYGEDIKQTRVAFSRVIEFL